MRMYSGLRFRVHIGMGMEMKLFRRLCMGADMRIYKGMGTWGLDRDWVLGWAWG